MSSETDVAASSDCTRKCKVQYYATVVAHAIGMCASVMVPRGLTKNSCSWSGVLDTGIEVEGYKWFGKPRSNQNSRRG